MSPPTSPHRHRHTPLFVRKRSTSAGSLVKSVTFETTNTDPTDLPILANTSEWLGKAAASAPSKLSSGLLATLQPTKTSPGPPVLYEDVSGSEGVVLSPPSISPPPLSPPQAVAASAPAGILASSEAITSLSVETPESFSTQAAISDPALSVSITPRASLRRSFTSQSRRTSLLLKSPHGAERRSSVLLVLADSVTEDSPRTLRLARSASASGLSRAVGKAWVRIKVGTGIETPPEVKENEDENDTLGELENWSGSEQSEEDEDDSEFQSESEVDDSLGESDFDGEPDANPDNAADGEISPHSDVSFSDASSRLASAAASASGSLHTSPSAGPSDMTDPVPEGFDPSSREGEGPLTIGSVYDSGEDELANLPIPHGTTPVHDAIPVKAEYVVPLADGGEQNATRPQLITAEPAETESSALASLTIGHPNQRFPRSSTAPPSPIAHSAQLTSQVENFRRERHPFHARSATTSSYRPTSRSYSPTFDVRRPSDPVSPAIGWFHRAQTNGLADSLEDFDVWARAAAKEVVETVVQDIQVMAHSWVHSTTYFWVNLEGHRIGMCYVLRTFGPLPSHPVMYYLSSMFGGWAIIFEHDHRVKSINRMILAYLLCEILPDVGPITRAVVEVASKNFAALLSVCRAVIGQLPQDFTGLGFGDLLTAVRSLLNYLLLRLLPDYPSLLARTVAQLLKGGDFAWSGVRDLIMHDESLGGVVMLGASGVITPFSGAKKKEQLKERNRRKREELLKFDEVDDNTHHSHAERNERSQSEQSQRRPLDSEFTKLTPKEVESRKLWSQTPVTRPLSPNCLEVDPHPWTEKNAISIPKRPSWSYEDSVDQLEEREKLYFQTWLTDLEGLHLELPYFEQNLEVWRQLWRVLELSDIVIVLVDIRHPLFHFNPSLYDHVVHELRKPIVLVLNKVDLVGRHTVQAWRDYLQKLYPMINIAECSCRPPGRRLPEEDPDMETLRRRAHAAKRNRRPTPIGVRDILDCCRDVRVVRRDGVTVDWDEVIARCCAHVKDGVQSDKEDNDGGMSEAIGIVRPRRRRKKQRPSTRQGDETQADSQVGDGDHISLTGVDLCGASSAESPPRRRGRNGRDRFASGHQREVRARSKSSGTWEKQKTWRDSDSESESDVEVAVDQLTLMGAPTTLPTAPRSDSLLTIGLVGQPNVGKSSIINSIVGSHRVSVSRTPGHTKYFQTIHVSDEVRLCDSPGLVFPSLVPRELQVLMGVFKVAQVQEPYTVVGYLANLVELERILDLKMEDILEFEEAAATEDSNWSAWTICEAFAIQRGFFTPRAARPDVYRAANLILRMAAEGRITISFKPPGFFRGV
ncbi:Guanine nucleotide-binding-like protein 1 [Gonapodya sp. JEL0774]|nr:Guanine nucleotide-binding-like protein 1 [Gonapodya sp. JEL0774]